MSSARCRIFPQTCLDSLRQPDSFFGLTLALHRSERHSRSILDGVLICPVRDCHLALMRAEQRLICASGHSFDVARSGIPHQTCFNPRTGGRSSPATRRLPSWGGGGCTIGRVTGLCSGGIAEIVAGEPSDIVLDAGCGDGFYLGALARQTGFAAHGIDIAIPAIDAAARRYPGCEWIVANADRLVPYSDRSFTIVLSITGRMNAGEFRRVLRDDGRLLVAIPAPEDLLELRGQGRDRVTRTVETFARDFRLLDQHRVATTADLDAAAVHDVLLSIYRPMRLEPAAAMRVTFSLDLLLFRAA